MRWSLGGWAVTSHGVLQQPERAAVQEGETGDGWSPRHAASSERGVNGKGQLVDGNTRIMAGDHVVVFCLQGAIHKLDKYFS